MKFEKLALFFNELEATPGRIEITKILARLVSEVESEEIDKAIYLSLGTLAPAYRGIVINVADKFMLRAIALSLGKSDSETLELYRKTGDLGDLIYEEKKRVNNKSSAHAYSITDVYNLFLGIAQEGGEGSQDRRIEALAKLLTEIDPVSAKYVARIPLGKLRLGFSELTIIDALSWFEKGDKSSSAKIKKAYDVFPDIGLISKRVKEEGIEGLIKNISPVIGVPVVPMLAQRLDSAEEMISKMGSVVVEPKLDGVRLQIHLDKDQKLAKAFTRNMNEVGNMFPEINTLLSGINAKQAILDVEAIGVDEERKSLVDFQTTMTRRRKHDIAGFAGKLPLCFYVFDVLSKNNENLLSLPLLERKRFLDELIVDSPIIKKVAFTQTTDPKVIEEKYKTYTKENLEGVVVKSVDSKYVPGRTGWRWVKMKQMAGSNGKLKDTIDAVVMGFSVGKGKRAKFGLGKFLVGILDGEEIKTITRVGTGLTDEEFISLQEKLEKIKVKDKPKIYSVTKIQHPDYWVEPEVVVEIAGDEITKSPTHTSGWAVRFPRLVKTRPDKSFKQTTTVAEIANLR